MTSSLFSRQVQTGGRTYILDVGPDEGGMLGISEFQSGQSMGQTRRIRVPAGALPEFSAALEEAVSFLKAWAREHASPSKGAPPRPKKRKPFRPVRDASGEGLFYFHGRPKRR